MIPDYIPECRISLSGPDGRDYSDPRGASDEEIAHLESRLDVRLPVSYRQLLAWAGHWEDGPLKGSDWHVDQVERNTKGFLEYAREHLSDLLDETVKPVCIFCRQGSSWCWLDPEEGDNPPVYGFDEDKQRKIFRFENLQTWFLQGF